MKQYYLSIESQLQEEREFYAEELRKRDWKFLKEAGEMFLIHAYSHRFKISQSAYKFAERYGGDPAQFEIFGDDEYKEKYRQFYLNLAVGLEILLKSTLLKKGIKINKPRKNRIDNDFDPASTISFGNVIEEHLDKIFPKLSETTLEEIKDTLRLINLRRNNIAHCSKKSHDHYAHEHRVSYLTLYIYEEFFYGDNSELTGLLLKSIEKYKENESADFKPLRIKPRSLRG